MTTTSYMSIINYKQSLRTILFFGTVLLSLPVPGCRNAPDMSSRKPAFSEKYTHIPNFKKVCDGLYRGGQPGRAGYRTLKKMGIQSIVNLRVLNLKASKTEKLGFHTYHISFKHVHPETEDVLKFLSIVTNPNNQPVFVHCHEGVDRTGMMIAVYRMVVQDWPRSKAIREMKRDGFNKDWNVPIEQYLRNVDIKMLKRKHLAVSSR